MRPGLYRGGRPDDERVLDEGWDPQDAHDEMVTDGFHTAFFGLNHYFEEQTGWED